MYIHNWLNDTINHSLNKWKLRMEIESPLTYVGFDTKFLQNFVMN